MLTLMFIGHSYKTLLIFDMRNAESKCSYSNEHPYDVICMFSELFNQ